MSKIAVAGNASGTGTLTIAAPSTNSNQTITLPDATGTFVTADGNGNITIASGTANGVTYLNGSKVLTSGTALVFDGTNLGIGTSSPAVPLDIRTAQGTLNLTTGSDPLANLNILNPDTTIGTGPTIAFSSYYNGTFTAPLATIAVERAVGAGTGSDAASNNIIFRQAQTGSTALTERLRLDSSGNLGLGVTPSAWASGTYKVFQLLGGGAVSGSSGQVNLSQNFVGESGGEKYIATAAASSYAQLAGSHRWYNAPSGTAGNAITFTQAMTLDASGNLGLGSNGRLDIWGSSSAGGLKITNTSDGSYAYSLRPGISNVSNFGFQIYDHKTGTIPFALDSSGNLLVGTTANGRTNSNGTAIDPTGIVYQNHITGTTSGTFYTRFSLAGTQIGSISQSGTTAVAYTTSSDYRLKNTIAPMTGALAKVVQLNPVTYKWNADDSESQGFIAHELQAVVPECVTGTKDAVETYTDEDGNEATRPVYQGIDTSFLVATLTAAIKEQQALIEQLQADVATLKGAA